MLGETVALALSARTVARELVRKGRELASVLRDEAEEDSLPSETPIAVRSLLKRCLLV